MERITATEALYGFAAWLTCRKEPVTFGAAYNAAPAAQLVSEYVQANGLPGVRQGIYPHNLTPPEAKGEVNAPSIKE